MRWCAGLCVLLMLVAPRDVWGRQEGGRSHGSGVGDTPPRPSVDPWAAAPLPLQRISGPIILDGHPDEEAWAGLDVLPMVQYWPVFEGAMSERTVVRVGYDDEYLYAAGWFYGDPDGIQGNSLRRDSWEGDDAFDLIIDSYNDDETALKFTTTPLGILLDQAIQNDAQPGTSGGPLNDDWNTFWDAATSRSEEGWFAEMRIPLSSLGFTVDDGVAVMGLIAGRYIAAKNETHIFPAIPPNRDMAEFMPSRARDVRLEGVTEQRPLWVSPYALTGVSRVRDPDAAVPRAPAVELWREVGLDLKYGLSSNLTLDLTVNTDFAQVESDALTVNLDRFGLFMPEKRQFFQERASTFEFDMGEGRLLHSRRIGLADDGTPRRILGGARMAGRVGDWDVGVFSMQVGGDAGAPWENDGALRVQRTFSRGGRAGAMLTSRVVGSGDRDLSVGVDGRMPVGPDLVTVQVAHTDNAGAVQGSVAERSAARVFWERRNTDGWGYDVDLSYSGAGYDPALGFEYRGDFAALKGRLRYAWQPAETSAVARYHLIAYANAFRRNRDGALESALARVRMNVDFRNGNWLVMALNTFREDVAEDFSLPGADVPAGRYPGMDLFTRFQMNRSASVGGAFGTYTGRAFDGWRARLTVEPWWRLSSHVTVGGLFSLNRLWFPSRDQRVVADQANVRLSVALDTHLSADAFLQYSAASDALAANLRIRYRFSEGRDLFLVMDEARDLVDRYGLDSAVLGRADRRLLLKYSHTLRP